jgi:hypothetical protein
MQSEFSVWITFLVSVMMASFRTRQLGQKVSFNLVEQRQFHLFWIHQNKLELGRVLLVNQRRQNHVETHRLALAGRSCHEQVRHFGQIGYKHLVGNGFTQSNGKVLVGLHKLFGAEHRLEQAPAPCFCWAPRYRWCLCPEWVQ